MKKTKELILDTALELFNTKGLSKVKLRTVANEMGISQGNLNYHFKKRADVIEALYFRLVQNINEHMPEVQESDNTMEVMFNMSRSVMQDLYNYRFILLDFVQIIRENEKIKIHFQQLQKFREKQFLDIFKSLIGNGLMRKESLPNEYSNLYTRLQILGDFWISSAITSPQSLTKKSIPKYEEIINQTIFPYLTAKGRRRYLLIAG